MIELLRDSAWQSLGVMFAIAAIFVSYWIYKRQERSTELVLGVISTRPLISVDSLIASKIEVTLDGLPLKNISLAIIGIKNSGNMPINSRDFERPISIEFGQKCSVVDHSIITRQPLDLGLKIRRDISSIEIEPMLINPLDQALVQVLVEGENPSISISARISGVSAVVDPHTEPPEKHPMLKLLLLMTATVGCIVLPLGLIFFSSKPILSTSNIGNIATTIIAVYVLSAVWRGFLGNLGKHSRRRLGDA